MLVTCPDAFVLPGAVAMPHDDGSVTLGVIVSVTGSLNATPDPVVTVTLSAEVLVPSAGTLVGLAVTICGRRRRCEEPERIDDDVYRSGTAVERLSCRSIEWGQGEVLRNRI